MTILISNFTSTALSADAGFIVRNEIIKAFSENPNEEIVLDFSGITLFATMFFNASIGYLVKERGDIVKKITPINLSELGKRTYNHSVENARTILDEETSKMISNAIDDN